MQRFVLLTLVLLPVALAVGCVERRFVITSDPPGAMVYRNGAPLGLTPVDDHFVYYGKYNFTLTRAKCETLHVTEDIQQPWYEIPGIDFVSENLYPFTVRDVRHLHYCLRPCPPDNPQALLEEAKKLRTRGQAIGTAVAPAPQLLGPAPQAPPGAPPVPGGLPAMLPSPPPGGGQPAPVTSQVPAGSPR